METAGTADPMTLLLPVLGDQLSHGLASLAGADRADAVVLMVEVDAEATYVRHHQKKIAFILSAMRHFAAELADAGWTVDYVRLDDPGNTQSFDGEVARAVARHGARAIRATEAGERRVVAMQNDWATLTGLPCRIVADDRFFCSLANFDAWAATRKRLRMEDFYRNIRVETGILMDDGAPAGGRWNFDADNRQTPLKGTQFPTPFAVAPDAITRDVLALVSGRFGSHFGDLEPFTMAVTRAQALAALAHFVETALPQFGDYQDAMVDGVDALFHSLLSPYLNAGLLNPREICAAAEAAYRAGSAPLNAVEGFIRQILGWREYVRGIYWRETPDYVHENALGATRDLPAFYWTGDTDMRCLRQAVEATRRNAMAHHIQRLMILGNFALLAEIDPEQVHEWFLAVYADAYEWVEAPNVIGMALHADGGRMASKPYAAGGAYINRMSDHCRHCRYNVRQRTGPDACPFNSLYWDFMARHRARLGGNQRLWNVYKGWDRFDPGEQVAIRAQAAGFLDALPDGARGWAITD